MFKALISALIVFSGTTAFADAQAPSPDKAEKGNDFFDTTLGKRVDECKGHFDLQPFVQIAITGDTKHDITPEVIDSFKTFTATGSLPLPADKAGDVVAQKCAVYAEGVLVGGIGHQLLIAFALAAEEAKQAPKTDDAPKK